jgi:hypothetical protein
MANVPETQTRVAQLERKVEIVADEIERLREQITDAIEALEIVLDAAETIARLWSGTKAYDLKEAITKLRA